MMDKTDKACTHTPQDFISSMPDNVITNILERLPLQDAMRTDVLSRNWRFKWTMLSQLVFDEDFYEYLLKTNNEISYGRIISRLLLHLEGPITKFVFSIDESYDTLFDCQDLNHWVLFLSKKGIKDVTLEKRDESKLKLPTHLFSCLELKHLKLVSFYEYLLKTNNEISYGRIISRLLLHLEGPITKFVFSIDESYDTLFDCQDLNHWVLFLSKKGIKDVTLEKRDESKLKLPTHLFSCLELKHLKLVSCGFDPPVSFHGFSNLLSFEFCGADNENLEFGDFFTRCPMLEILNMSIAYSPSKVKLADIAKLTNLKVLSLTLCNLDNNMILNSHTIFELLDFLPKLQELDLNFLLCGIMEDDAKKRFPTIFPSLKTLRLSRIDLDNMIEFSCAFEMIMSFPNLQTLEISVNDWDYEPKPAFCPPKIDYDTMELLQLQSVVFTYYSTSDNEVWLIKYLLAISPFLKTIVICPHPFPLLEGGFMFARRLLKLHRASPFVDIDLY